MNKKQKKVFCFVFYFPLVSQYCSYVFVFNISYFSIAQYLENVCQQRSPSLVKNSDTPPLVKNSDTCTKDAHENKSSE